LKFAPIHGSVDVEIFVLKKRNAATINRLLARGLVEPRARVAGLIESLRWVGRSRVTSISPRARFLIDTEAIRNASNSLKTKVDDLV
jgi:hypothetical protein